MFQPQSYFAVLSFTILSMLCKGSWAYVVKLCPVCRVQRIYGDYVGDLNIGSPVWDLTLGGLGYVVRQPTCLLFPWTGAAIISDALGVLVWRKFAFARRSEDAIDLDVS